MSYNLSDTQFHYVRKFVLTQQLLKSLHFLMESGDADVVSSCQLDETNARQKSQA